MAILSAVVVPGKALKGGRHKVRIAVAHNGETRYIVTDIQIDSLKTRVRDKERHETVESAA